MVVLARVWPGVGEAANARRRAAVARRAGRRRRRLRRRVLDALLRDLPGAAAGAGVVVPARRAATAGGRVPRSPLVAAAAAGAVVLLRAVAVPPGRAADRLAATSSPTAQIVVDRAVARQRRRSPAPAPTCGCCGSEAVGWPGRAPRRSSALVWLLAGAPGRRAAAARLPAAVPAVHQPTPSPASRYLNPVLPFLALFAGWALARLAARVARRPALFWSPCWRCRRCPAQPASIGPTCSSARPTPGRWRSATSRRTSRPAPTILVQPYSVPLTSRATAWSRR